MVFSILKGFQDPKKIKYNFIALGIVGFVLQIICLIIFSFARFWIENGYIPNEISGSIGFGSLLGVPALFIGSILFHEAVHGVAFKFFGYKVKYGLLFPYAAYAIAENQLIKKSDYLFVALAPLIIIDSIAIVLFFLRISLLSDITFFLLVVNTAGAIGDLWMAWQIIKSPKGALFFDSSPKDNYIYIPNKLK